MKLIIFFVVLAGLLVGGYSILGSPGCEARTAVAKDKLIERIDNMIGKLDVQRKQIDISMRAMKLALGGMRKAKIKAQVKRDQIQAKADPVNARIASIDLTLTKLRDYLAANQLAEIGGRNYSPAELKEMADKVLAARKEFVAQANGFKKVQDQLQAVSDSMQRKQSEYEKRLASFQAQVTEIDSKLIALKAMKDASKAMDSSDKTFAENVGKLEDQIADLYASVETELRTEDERWNESEATRQIETVDGFITATQAPLDTLAEIEKVLGGNQ